MKLHILSDLHREFSGIDSEIGDVESDVVILAGYIHPGAQGIAWAGRTWLDRPVIYVPGNHEYYGHHYQAHRRSMREVALQFDNLCLLDQRAQVINDVLFIGCTLWTDFRLTNPRTETQLLESVDIAQRCMADFRLIRYKDDVEKSRSMTPSDTAQICATDLKYIQFYLEKSNEDLAKLLHVDSVRTRVVVTHHSPTAQSIHPRFRCAKINPAFASRFEKTAAMANLWIHGHMHNSFDYRLELDESPTQTRVVCNPRGYCRWPGGEENPEFNQNLVIDI